MGWQYRLDEKGNIRLQQQMEQTNPVLHLTPPKRQTDELCLVNCEENRFEQIENHVRSDLNVQADPSNIEDIDTTQNPISKFQFNKTIWFSTGLAVFAAISLGGIFSIATLRIFEPHNIDRTNQVHWTSASNETTLLHSKDSNTDSNRTMHTIFTVQTGVYQKNETARKLADQLRAFGYAAVYAGESPTTVFAGIFDERASADDSVRKLRAIGQEAIVKVKQLNTDEKLTQLLLFWLNELNHCHPLTESYCPKEVSLQKLIDAHLTYRMNETPQVEISNAIDPIWQALKEALNRNETAYLRYAQVRLNELIIQLCASE